MSDPRRPVDDGATIGATADRDAGDATQDTAAPVADAASLPRKAAEGPRDLLEQLKFQDVVVWANAITYRGMLLGADDEELYLRTSLRYVTVRMDRITKIAPAGTSDQLNPLKHVDASFYRVDEGEPPDVE